jgi:hypothetical protein
MLKRLRATELRTMADGMHDLDAKKMYLDLAQSYERAADLQEMLHAKLAAEVQKP